uniref:Protein kinase domain-containing protein n=1 Tax=Paramormyrops kingsleyae TaxID=1676925 RepID=A0A3B3RW71_9TELE
MVFRYSLHLWWLVDLEDAHILEGDSNLMSDKHGCLAQVSPEILNRRSSSSGKWADMWSWGVMLYTLLPSYFLFSDVDRSALLSKIRQGKYWARCLLTAAELLLHP